MDALGIREFFFKQTMNCQTVVFPLEKIHSSLLICNQFCLKCSGEWFFLTDSGEKSETLIRYPYHNCEENFQFWKLWSNLCSRRWLILDEVVSLPNSFVVVTIKKTSWGGFKKFEDIAFENTQTFSAPNARI